MLINFKGKKRYTLQNYRKLKRVWLKWDCDFTYENIKRLQEYFPERSIYSLAIHLFQVLPHKDRFNWQKFSKDYDSVKLKEQRRRRGKGLTEAQKVLILKKYDYRCGFCGRGFDEKDVQVKVEFHHIVPLFLGGKDNIANREPVCFGCHKKLHHFGIRFVGGKMYVRVGRNCYREVSF